MRDDWNRSTPLLHLGHAELTALIQLAFPEQEVVESELTQGGLVNTNIRVRLAPSQQLALIRLYMRSPEAGRKEYMLHQSLGGKIRMPHYFHFAEQNPFTQHPYAIVEWIAGERLEVVTPKQTVAQLGQIGRSIGATLAQIHAVTFPQTGFFGPNLEIAQPISVGGEALLAYLRQCLVDGQGGQRLGADLTNAVLALVEREAGILDTWQGPPCLVHGDFGGSNILVRAGLEEREVASVLDWEFAFSGSPFFDLGNLLRPPLGQLEGFQQAVQEGYTGAGGVLPAEWRRMSHLIDLLSWADFLNRPTANAALIRTAQRIITETVRFAW